MRDIDLPLIMNQLPKTGGHYLGFGFLRLPEGRWFDMVLGLE